MEGDMEATATTRDDAVVPLAWTPKTQAIVRRDFLAQPFGDGPGAASILEEIEQREMPNVDLERRFISRAELTEELAVADIVLGVFGASDKTARVVPCNVYDGLAAGRCVVTGDGEAPRELLKDGEEVVLVRRNDPEALAAALRRLDGNPALRDQFADAARAGSPLHGSSSCTEPRPEGTISGLRAAGT